MDSSSNLQKASLDDIVFQGRNRAYGAYLLRQIYGRHIMIATIVGLSLFLFFLSIPLISEMFSEEEKVEVVQRVITEVELAPPPPLDKNTPPPPPPPPPPPAAPAPPPVRSAVKFTPPVVKRDEEVVKQEVPDQKQLEKVDAGTETVKGVDNAPVSLEGIEGGTSDIVAEVVEEKPYEYVEQMPTFPGGEKALYDFIGKNVRYPAIAIRSKVEGIAFVRFTVTKTGEVTDVEVLKDPGAGTGEEAVRVIKKLPRFNPGKQNGRAVAVKYSVPVHFKIK